MRSDDAIDRPVRGYWTDDLVVYISDFEELSETMMDCEVFILVDHDYGKYVGVPVGHEIWIYVGDSGWYRCWICLHGSE